LTVKLEEAQARADFAEKSVNNLQKALHRLESVQALKMGDGPAGRHHGNNQEERADGPKVRVLVGAGNG
jgi:hypothetical protein